MSRKCNNFEGCTFISGSHLPCIFLSYNQYCMMIEYVTIIDNCKCNNFMTHYRLSVSSVIDVEL